MYEKWSAHRSCFDFLRVLFAIIYDCLIWRRDCVQVSLQRFWEFVTLEGANVYFPCFQLVR